MNHYFTTNTRKTVKQTIRFTPDEMQVIDTVMESLGRTNKTQFLHNTLMSAVCRFYHPPP